VLVGAATRVLLRSAPGVRAAAVAAVFLGK
jgi:hypothetical protein